MVRIRGVKCAIAQHLLKSDSVLITNPKHVEFIRKRIKDFRPEEPVCSDCAKNLIDIYDIKLRRAVELSRQRKSMTTSSSSSVDEYDRILYQTPLNKKFRKFVKENAPFKLSGHSKQVNGEDKENRTDNAVRAQSSTDIASPSPERLLIDSGDSIVEINIHTTESDPLNFAATTSAAAEDNQQEQQQQIPQNVAEQQTTWRQPQEPHQLSNKRKKVTFPQQSNLLPATTHITADLSSTSDDDDFMPSLNAMNGTRLPHVQPILKRRHIAHPIPEVNEIFMQGITGG